MDDVLVSHLDRHQKLHSALRRYAKLVGVWLQASMPDVFRQWVADYAAAVTKVSSSRLPCDLLQIQSRPLRCCQKDYFAGSIVILG